MRKDIHRLEIYYVTITMVILVLNVIVLLPSGTLLRESADDVWLEMTALPIISL